MNLKEVWIFDAGVSFSGNPKWLFLYMNDYYKEIEKYWFSTNKDTVRYVRSLGFKAYTYDSLAGKKIMKQATTYVINQFKEFMPDELRKCKILNLWHGVGCKSIERKISNAGFLREKMAKKYIKYNEQYINNTLFLVTSKLMEEHFKNQCGLRENQILRAGYPCCMYQGKVKTFDHDIIKSKGLNDKTKIVVYSPTFRDNMRESFFHTAIPDMNKLISVLEEKNILLIFKMHPLMLKEQAYKEICELYKDNKNLLFWDNSKDIYEIFDKIDVAIVDYSSIFYDMLACKVKKFIRYIFDYNDKENFRELVFDYKEMTCGIECYDFKSLLKTLSELDSIEDDEEDREKIYKLFWEYTSDDSFEKIIKDTLNFKIEPENELKTLYSFDVFDTLISRKCFLPKGIFYYVKEKMQTSKLDFDVNLINQFPKIRRDAERNVRERKMKNVDLKKTKKYEVTLEEIYLRLKKIYRLSNEQIDFLMKTEIEAELMNVEPIKDKINYLFDLVDKGNDVILISDMYLPKEIIVQMLNKADKRLAKIPLYLSSEYKVQKNTKELYIEILFSLNCELKYDYKEWIHYGDNEISDDISARALGIKTKPHKVEQFNAYEENIIKEIGTYESFLMANILRKKRLKSGENNVNYFAYAYVSFYLVPYVNWVIDEAIKDKYDTIYFISRDGYYLKIIADEIIKNKSYKLKTKYIYGSRKAWRLPSYIDKVDVEFFSEFGNLTNDIADYSSLLNALYLTEKQFNEFFSDLSYLKNEKFDKKLIASIRPIIKNSKKYQDYLLSEAAKKRKFVLEYLNQEIDFNEKFAFVEYWGRGYTQNTLHRLLTEARGVEQKTIFYYARSIWEDEKNIIRKNFNSNVTPLTFIELIFSNIGYESIAEYCKKNGKIEPVIKENINSDKKMQSILEDELKNFAFEFSSLEYIDEDGICRDIYNYSLDYMTEHPGDKFLLKYMATVYYSESMYEKKKEYAPEIKLKDFFSILKGEKIENKTRNLDMSLARSKKYISKLYCLKNKVSHNEKVIKIVRKYKRKN